MPEPERARILLVDDEPNVLEGIALHLKRQYDVVTAPNGAAALAIMNHVNPPSVIISDMRMPGMDGATLLASVRRLYPSTVRILLTGQANVTAAIAAINEGQVFRFLTKPCPPDVLRSTVTVAIEQHRLVTAERVLLRETLLGSVEALTEVLSLTNPVSFGWATGVKRLAGELADHLAFEDRWQIEIAAMFSQLGYVTLPSEVAEKVYYGNMLTPEEAAMVARVPDVTDRLLAHIPRLQPVRDLLRAVASDSAITATRSTAPRQHLGDAAELLAVATRYLQLEARGETPASAIAILRARVNEYDSRVVRALEVLRGTDARRETIREVPLTALRSGMTLAAELRLSAGTLLAPRGYVMTESFVERCRNIKAGGIVEPVRVSVPERPGS